MAIKLEDIANQAEMQDNAYAALIEDLVSRQPSDCCEAKQEVYDLSRVGREVGGWQEKQYREKLGATRITVSSQKVTFELKEATAMHGMQFDQTFSYDIYGKPPDIAIAELRGVRYDGQPVTKIEIKNDKVIFIWTERGNRSSNRNKTGRCIGGFLRAPEVPR